MTSAPRSARIAEQNGPGTNIEKSTTVTPASGSHGSAWAFKVRRRVDYEHARSLARDDEEMGLAGREEARVARRHLEFLARDFGVRRALEEIAHLLDPGVEMRQRALAALDFADQHFHLLRAHGLGADQAEIARAGVVGGRVRFDVALPDEIAHESLRF